MKDEYERIRLAERIFGWNLKRTPKNRRILSKNDLSEIIELPKGKKIFCINELRVLGLEELLLIESVLKKIQSDNNQKKINPNFLLKLFCEENFIELEEEQKETISKYLDLSISGKNFLKLFLEKRELEEIAMTGIGAINPIKVYHTVFGWLDTLFYFSSEEKAKDTVNKLSSGIGRRLSLETPRINAVLDNGSRIHSSIKPIAFTGMNFTIRKFNQAKFTPLELARIGSIPFELLAFIWMCIESDCSFLVCGNTGSGKTTLLNSLLYFVPQNERIIAVEETPEIKIMHKNFVKLNPVKETGIELNDLIDDTLRMRPDRVVVGEVRNSNEAKAFANTLLAGQGKGSYATFHALSAEESVSRLDLLGFPIKDLKSLDLVIVQKRWTGIDLKKRTRKENRKVIEVSEIGEKTKQLFEFNYSIGKLEKISNGIKSFEKISRTFGMNEKEILKELEKRKNALKKWANTETSIRKLLDNISFWGQNHAP